MVSSSRRVFHLQGVLRQKAMSRTVCTVQSHHVCVYPGLSVWLSQAKSITEEEKLRVKEAYICVYHVRWTIVIHFTVSLWVWCSDFLCFTLEESRAQRRKTAYPDLTQVVDSRVGIETPGYLQSLKFAVMLEIARRKRCVCVFACAHAPKCWKESGSLSDTLSTIRLWLLLWKGRRLSCGWLQDGWNSAAS